MPVVIFIVVIFIVLLDLGKKSSFLDRHYVSKYLAEIQVSHSEKNTIDIRLLM
jgi:hypothetical protein